MTFCLASKALTSLALESMLLILVRSVYQFKSVSTGLLIVLGALGAVETGIFVDAIDKTEGVTKDVS